ncbi:superkiller complex protein 2-like [Tigriopus californicus]|uniref:superkiller complex protein 2-like n=1 Tax=Tigriopus californicus TaxID=6832 RepID=UPI0027DA9CD4|nr:superkiller complex protein 2-like [Tigriopus californicus]
MQDPVDLMAVLGPPPILASLEERLESYLLSPEDLPIHADHGDEIPTQLAFWDRIPQPERVLHLDTAPIATTLKVQRDLATGDILGFQEVNQPGCGSTAKNSTSLTRAPGAKMESFMGSSTNYPFWPGGFDQPELSGSLLAAGATDPIWDDVTQYATCPPGFARGINFDPLVEPATAMAARGPVSEMVDLASMLTLDDQSGLFEASQTSAPVETALGSLKASIPSQDGFWPDDTGVPVLTISKGPSTSSGLSATEWAEIVDVTQPMTDFHQKVPQMAFTWPFELDTFQKQAVLRLESNESVFVAAHTSAGKTVVAEYAIALSQKHMTRTIYTSPIKALSNQKFRDFKDTFQDVGLVTGDIQINPTATCLIMTTEILRSMLYNGSDIIRDLEYVIFDEVHYINDAERGVVWEEVLILLPNHVNIIMLSATVPNTLVFADWVGRTKKKKIYVISTLKRPVPLEHFLYTGSNAKSRDEMFLLQNAQGQFLQEGYNKAYRVKKDRESKGKASTGAKGVRDRVGPQQEKNIWLTLIDHLQRKDKLPVVSFTLSRNRCDQNAALLTSMDLTTAVEKSDIHHFIHKCVSRLKGSDRKLPQVLQLTELLKRGIGIHHSGILPILKEVVEMLFQRGWVKLLFATETFAMGINMPARTVVFDNIKKHDGKNFRTLLPAEYIQMAGRAGRRGLDSTGTVIILVKNELHDMAQLHGMMQGKPTQLESKFRLTYSMILNLLRVEQLRVEDMMKRSFSEINNEKKKNSYKDRVRELEVEIANQQDLQGPLYEEIKSFYRQAAEFFQIRDQVWPLVLSHPTAIKLISAGRVVVLNIGNRVNTFGMILGTDKKSLRKTYSVLIQGEIRCDGIEKEADLNRFLSLGYDYSTDVIQGDEHSILEVNDDDIIDITTKSMKIDADKILESVKRRQIPRFKNDPPGQSVILAITELKKYADLVRETNTEMVNLIRDLKIQDMDLVTDLQKMQSIRDNVSNMSCTSMLDFKNQFTMVYQQMKLQAELEHTQFLMSENSLTFLPDYHKRIEVLRSLRYIDDNNTVQLKGRVACEMGSHELMMTELILDNFLRDRHPAEIAALLSCMVFQQKNCSAPELTESLQKGVEDIKLCATRIGQVQKDCGMEQAVQDYVEQFNFGLVEVVYEWARGMPFSEITRLTDVQEGVIVRTIQRLDETLRDVKDAARVIGEPVLYQKMDESSNIVKRDIVFAASLYTQ